MVIAVCVDNGYTDDYDGYGEWWELWEMIVLIILVNVEINLLINRLR